jgi:hypothetical protein
MKMETKLKKSNNDEHNYLPCRIELVLPLPILLLSYTSKCRSQWPRCLRHQMPAPAEILGLCVRIPLEAWASARVSSLFVFCIGSSLATGLITRLRIPISRL